MKVIKLILLPAAVAICGLILFLCLPSSGNALSSPPAPKVVRLLQLKSKWFKQQQALDAEIKALDERPSPNDARAEELLQSAEIRGSFFLVQKYELEPRSLICPVHEAALKLEPVRVLVPGRTSDLRGYGLKFAYPFGRFRALTLEGDYEREINVYRCASCLRMHKLDPRSL
jgi:hypothetical protein